MTIAISAAEPQWESSIAPQFGRCPYFIFVDPATGDWEAVPNPALEASGGAGTQAAQLVSQKGAQAVISGQFGPKAEQVLHTAGVALYTAGQGTIPQLVRDYQAGRLTPFAS